MGEVSNREMQKRFITVFLVLFSAFLLILPDFVFSLFSKTFKHSTDVKVLILIVPLSIGLVMNRYRWLSILLVSLLCVFQLMQFSHIAYFGTQMSPYSIFYLTKEFRDVVLEFINVFSRYYYVLPIVLLPFSVMLYCIRSKCNKSIIGTMILLVLFSYIGYNRFKLGRFTPNEMRFTIDNSLKAMFGCVELAIFREEPKNYLPYEIKTIKKNIDEPITVVYILGESCNYNHMSLFGYERDTTPKLKALSKRKDFYHTIGIAGGMNTLSSCKFMMNVIREPNNLRLKSSIKTNLFSLAKKHGFKTFYISSQRDNVLGSISGVNYIDHVITNGSGVIKTNKLKDCNLLNILSGFDLGKLNFIVLHQTCVHAPYSEAFDATFRERNKFSTEKDSRINEYDNAMLYNDHLISKFFDYFNKQTQGKFYIIWASDHNELLGENGMFGHGHLIPQTADIPIVIQSNDNEFMNKIRDIFKLTHYDIAKNIAYILGYEIQNPNEKDAVFYISGLDFNGKCEYIKYRKDFAAKRIEYLKESE
ncbi:MAG: sulfatase-like hydrolase/transferase [Holosporales bacterium]|jgi:glucan phosphoethanolaminetransferase (alkaline phosphatase superfamily)|nr:sulfatase-like hydrolase/transferase [Holosporales bacterium]